MEISRLTAEIQQLSDEIATIRNVLAVIESRADVIAQLLAVAETEGLTTDVTEILQDAADVQPIRTD